MMKSVLSGLIAGVSVCLSVTAGFAATSTGNLNVTLTIVGGCGILTTTPVNFGTASYISGNLSAQGSISVVCSLNVPYTIGLDGGQSGSISARHMMNGASTVTYQLYQDSSFSTVWGNSTGQYYNGTGTGLAQVIPVYGQVAGPQAVVTGLYQDSVVVTVTY
ncbi:MAG: Secreted pili protein involved in motility and biofilm formation [Candidatus Tokpelaia hoelldobleri]|uniref:Secreted pili protein involved in motility and biofilm formation n=1 Tax=Candidatus Tokpelaia hoelldobleri TaxID=1902579 RepID=A0A1U9JVJ2_9HYPH|nr:MAG: Secreted pili protein involved in motility and biofilm formation [Candidatus Tokpelaia hoelldoblerii]